MMASCAAKPENDHIRRVSNEANLEVVATRHGCTLYRMVIPVGVSSRIVLWSVCHQQSRQASVTVIQ